MNLPDEVAVLRRQMMMTMMPSAAEILTLMILLMFAGVGAEDTSLTSTTRHTDNNATFCQKIMLPMCKGQMRYQYTHLPVTVLRHTYRTQAQVAAQLELIWPFLDLNCSPNLRLAACGMYLPKCNERTHKVIKPCRSACIRAKRSCRDSFRNFGRAWLLPCQSLPRARRGRNKGCIPRINKPPVQRSEETRCERIHVPMCQALAFNKTFLPNMFLMANQTDIQTELDAYQELIDTSCSPHLQFLLCGIYLPFCINAVSQFAVPCRSVCQQVRDACIDDFQRLYGIDWVSKLQCHRYPEKGDTTRGYCVLLNDTMDTLLRAADVSATERQLTTAVPNHDDES